MSRTADWWRSLTSVGVRSKERSNVYDEAHGRLDVAGIPRFLFDTNDPNAEPAYEYTLVERIDRLVSKAGWPADDVNPSGPLPMWHEGPV